MARGVLFFIFLKERGGLPCVSVDVALLLRLVVRAGAGARARASAAGFNAVLIEGEGFVTTGGVTG
jgi:hypothetical protein